MHWQEIEVPGNVPIPSYHSAFAPLNLTEIVIAGGTDKNNKMVVSLAVPVRLHSDIQCIR